MKPIFHNVEQNTEEWENLRMGKFTASKFKDLFLSKTTKGYEKAIYLPVYERLTGESPESFSSNYMERGHEMEPEAKETYEIESFNIVKPGGFWSLNGWVGASPDGLIGENGIWENKSPAYNTMINYLLNGKLPNIYKWQVYGQLYVTGREWCDFTAYHPKLKLLTIRIHRDEKIINELSTKLNESIDIAKNLIKKLG
jgi:hypothetical protein